MVNQLVKPTVGLKNIYIYLSKVRSILIRKRRLSCISNRATSQTHAEIRPEIRSKLIALKAKQEMIGVSFVVVGYFGLDGWNWFVERKGRLIKEHSTRIANTTIELYLHVHRNQIQVTQRERERVECGVL